ncbi:MAG: DUF58 domain-containing protein [Clostridiaceae bacterium]|nr:DUF58 domain-containing protein [Clostridiaceae bacterium]
MILFLLILLALCGALQAWSLTHALDGVSHANRAEPPVAEPEEPFFLVTQVTNASRRFVPFVRISEDLPAALCVSGPGITLREGGVGGQQMDSTIYLLPRQKYTRHLPVSLPARGRYVLRGAKLYGGDFLGLSETTHYFPHTQEIVILPRRWKKKTQLTTLGGFLGDVSVSRFIFEDPVLTLGFREYTGREPQKMISWPQSARMGRLMVKNYDHTLELSVSVLLSVEGAAGLGCGELLEGCFSLARTVCETLEQRKIGYRFFTNARAVGAISLWGRVAEGLGTGHLSAILEGLGRASYEPTGPFSRVLSQAARAAEPGRCHVLIAPASTPKLRADAAALRGRTGGAVLILTPNEEVRL